MRVHGHSGNWTGRLSALSAVLALALLAAALFAGCGSSDSSDADSSTEATTVELENPIPEYVPPNSEAGLAEVEGKKEPTYHVRLEESEFPTEQKVGEVALMRLSFKNEGKNVVPNFAVTISIAGTEGDAASEPFAVRAPGALPAQPDSRIWVLLDGYPRALHSSEPGVPSKADPKTFTFGPVQPEKEIKTEWRLRAVKAGQYTIGYKGEGDLSSTSSTISAFPEYSPSGEFAVKIKPGE